jgi:hypothetical protein
MTDDTQKPREWTVGTLTINGLDYAGITDGPGKFTFRELIDGIRVVERSALIAANERIRQLEVKLAAHEVQAKRAGTFEKLAVSEHLERIRELEAIVTDATNHVPIPTPEHEWTVDDYRKYAIAQRAKMYELARERRELKSELADYKEQLRWSLKNEQQYKDRMDEVYGICNEKERKLAENNATMSARIAELEGRLEYAETEAKTERDYAVETHARFEEALEEIRKLERTLELRDYELAISASDFETLERENARLREALTWYAEYKNYKSTDCYAERCPAERDEGCRARRALASEREGGE